MRNRVPFTLVVSFLALTVRVGAAESRPTLGDLRKVGTVHLPTSCAPAVEKDFARATALLHSFFYDEARRVFTEVAVRDPRCAMAHWGIAMTFWHPIWTPPTPAERDAGRQAIEKAKSLGGRTDLERGLIAALDAFYTTPAAPASGPVGQSCHGPTGGGDHAARALAYEKALESLRAGRPEDVEVGTFYALALLATAPPTDRTLKNQTRATEILEPLYRKHPDHPGIVHYLIHGYDYPPVAARGLAAAKAYAEIAPWVPHVLHMPSHIFTRLGMWGEVIESNLASADAARQYAAGHHPGATSFEELHALDYLVYGYLQTAQDGRAKEVLAKTQAVRRTHPEADFAASYAIGAVPARFALERRQWAEAAALVEPPAPSLEQYPFGAGHLAFARALGAARAGRLDEARRAIERLQELAAGMTDPRLLYFGRQAEMQIRAVQGWLAFAEGRADEGEKLLREAADADDALGKHPVSPGSILPAREILADLLLERGRHREALADYRRCLELNPRRLNSLFGAGRAAELAGEEAVARRHYGELAAMAAEDATRPEVKQARQFLASGRSAAR
jgi:tetratricopeptide (TPR) repeat protein